MKSVVIKVFSIGLVAVGIIFLVSATFPILQYELTSAQKFKKPKLLSPLGEGLVQGLKKDPYPLDLTKASNWFADGQSGGLAPASEVRYYNISIPKLGIENAVAENGGEDLTKNLIHYKGTALPGRLGNSVVFGHSILPQFFNPENYISIFSTLPTLEEGDEIVVNYDGITYRYKIFEMFEVAPQDVYVLEQTYDDSYLSLITCVPPGTYLRRLVVKSRLMSSQ